MRRLSTSAIDTIDEHNRSIDRTPHTAPGVAPKRSSNKVVERRLSPPPAALAEPGGRASFEAQPAERSQVRGSRWEVNPIAAPPTTIARDGNLSPTRSARAPLCRELAPAQAWRYLRRGDPPKRASTSSPGRAPLSQSHRRVGPPLASPREKEHDPPHPRCLPSTGFPRRVDNLGRPPLPAWRPLGPTPYSSYVLPGSTKPWFAKSRPHRASICLKADFALCDRSAPVDFCVRLDPQPDVPRSE